MAEGRKRMGVRTQGSGKGMPQLRAERSDGFNEAKRTAFLEHLGATSNVKSSARVAGVAHSSVRRARRRDPEFRAQWDDALVEGYGVLEEQSLCGALAGTRVAEPRSAAGMRRLQQSQSVALKLLSNHARRVAAIRERRAEGRHPDEVLAEIREKLAVIRARTKGAGRIEGKKKLGPGSSPG